MNCLDFHREKLADPRRLSVAARGHASDCASCLAFAQSVDESEAQIERALATPVPEGLAARVLLQRRNAARPAWRAWALAASIVLSIAVGFNALKTAAPVEDAKYATYVIEHVVESPESFTTLLNTGPDALNEAIRSVGGKIKEPIGRVRYIKLCPVGKDFGWHIVFETPQGLATLILVPNRQIGLAESASMGGWSALVRPARMGYYAVVTASAENTEIIDRQIKKRVEWVARRDESAGLQVASLSDSANPSLRANEVMQQKIK